MFMQLEKDDCNMKYTCPHIFSRAAMRSSMGGWVLNSLANTCPVLVILKRIDDVHMGRGPVGGLQWFSDRLPVSSEPTPIRQDNV